MGKFKAGDVLRCIDASGSPHGVALGAFYTVRNVGGPMGAYVSVDSDVDCAIPGWDESRFELAVKKPPTHHEIHYVQEEPKVEPPQHCRCCNLRAPMKLSHSPYASNVCGYPTVMPDTTGWMVILFPWKDMAHHKYEGTDVLREASYVCPKCAQTVMGTLVHLSTPGAAR